MMVAPPNISKSGSGGDKAETCKTCGRQLIKHTVRQKLECENEWKGNL